MQITATQFLSRNLLMLVLLTLASGCHGEIRAVTWDEAVTVATGEGVRGPWRMNDSDFRYVDDPSVAINDEGIVAVVWADQAEQELYLQVYDTDGTPRLDTPTAVTGMDATFSWLPRVAIGDGANPNIYLLWQEIIFSGGTHGGEIYFARATDNGREISAPRNLSNTEAGAGKGRLHEHRWDNGSLDLIRGDDGTLHVAWTEYEGSLYLAHSRDNGKSFSEPYHLAGDNDSPARGPTLASHPERGLWVAWTTGENPEADILYSHSDDQGESFTRPEPAITSEGLADAPSLAIDSRGHVDLVFAENPDREFAVRHARLETGDAGFSQPRTISTPHPGEGYGHAHYPRIALDGEDRRLIIWELFPAGTRAPAALAFSLASTALDPSEPAAIPGTEVDENSIQGSQQGLLMRKHAVNKEGAIAVVNSHFHAGEGSRIQLIRGRLD